MGAQPPHRFTIHFRLGGCGTFLPLFLSSLTEMRRAAREGGAAGPARGPGEGRAPPPPISLGPGGPQARECGGFPTRGTVPGQHRSAAVVVGAATPCVSALGCA